MNDISFLVDDTGILLTKKVFDAGFSKYDLQRYIRENGFEPFSRGVYLSPDAFADESYVLSLRCPAAVFSHDEALYHYGLIDREPMQPTITVYSGYGVSRLTADGIRVYTVKRELLDAGKTTVKSPFGHDIPMYDPERTVCDLVRSRSRFEIQDYQTALKSYIARPDKDLNRLMAYAKLFHVDGILRTVMEVLL